MWCALNKAKTFRMLSTTAATTSARDHEPSRTSFSGSLVARSGQQGTMLIVMLFLPPLRAPTVAPCIFLLSVSILQRCADDTGNRGSFMDHADDPVAGAHSKRVHNSCSETKLSLSSWLACLFWFPMLSDTPNWPRSFKSSCCPGEARPSLFAGDMLRGSSSALLIVVFL